MRMIHHIVAGGSYNEQNKEDESKLSLESYELLATEETKKC